MNDDITLDEDTDGVSIDPDADGGLEIRVDPDSELGEKIAWHAGHRGEDPDDFLADIIEEAIEREQGGRR